MAGYRPKSLDELNSMYGKTLAAERAIKKGSSLVEKTAESTLSSNLTEDIERIAEEVKQSMGMSDEINDFIAKFAFDKDEENTDRRPNPQITVFEAEEPEAEASPAEIFEIEAEDSVPVEIPENPKLDKRDLMDEYMRIMNDEEDDELPQKKLSRKEKKKLKMMEKREAEKFAKEQEPAEAVPETAEESFVELSDESEEDVTEAEYKFSESAPDEFKAPEYISLSPEPGNPHVTFQEENVNDFDFPENYTPGWMKDESESEENKAPAKPKKAKQQPKKANNTPAKILLCIALAVLVFIGSTATVFKTLIPVNTGKAVNDTFYFFTAHKDYTDLDINKGDLIITEKRYTQDGDIFAYVDYSNKSFEFGRRNDSITNDDGVVLLVTENQGNRTLVSRDDCMGVLFTAYPTVGTVIGILADNYVIIIAAVALSVLVIILTLALAFRAKETAKAPVKSKAKSKKAVKETEEETEIEELEEIDLFTTIG